MADPLHRIAGTLDWRHEFSGWIFAPQAANMQRIGEPYQLDGGDDVGARYASSGSNSVSLVLEIHTGAAQTVLPEGAAFNLDAPPELHALRAVKSGEISAMSVQYLATFRDWTVRILATAGSSDELPQLDAAVRALPWRTLGAAERLH
jgi:hypothetical protein